MAFDLVSAYAESFTPFYVTGDSGSPPTLVESPQQITLRFSPGVVIDGSAASLGSISMRRSGRGGDAFGAQVFNVVARQRAVTRRQRRAAAATP